ncbi:LuxR family transcriptional regulator [Virgisporangium aliadipatigenens]|uniref:LuxR family transcriptional regulator n=1 Tax=Virgisporangium aliadipatigenens TaxID=741659 RepID=A0A8J3YR03_9ACTN|nr:LuxR family transcriptional regulator [Virgisporangium aliadipatigenens]GIJ50224.1 LuxR family transcriptional regulator [Virgisporangium aliadipatigenens]
MPQAALVGRGDERARLDALARAARAGHGGALVLRGEAGIGKSALLAHARAAAAGFRVIDASGAQFESELPFAALHRLCVPLLGGLDALPARHREALRVAFGLVEGTPELFRVGLSTLDLVAAAARERPLLCLVDNAQWLDDASARALTFLARRLDAEPVAVLFAARPSPALDRLDGLPALDIGGLDDVEARELLAAGSRTPLDEQVRDRIVAEARGNPLALLVLPRAGGFAPPAASVPSRIEDSFRARLAALSQEARALLTVASADPTGDPGLLWSAARLLDLDVAATSAAAAGSGLVEFDTHVRFCHPLARSAVYRAASDAERRTAHRVLGEVTDPVADPDRRAWHRAQACAGPDDDVAAELERSAARARSRGGVVAAAAFVERAAALSLDPAARIERTLAAVRAQLDAGATDTAARLLTTVENAALDELRRAQVDLLRGRIAFLRRTDDGGPGHMLRAAVRLAPLDAAKSRESFLDAFDMGLVVGRPDGVLAAILAAAPPSQEHDLLEALRLLYTEGHGAAVPLLRQVLDGPQWTARPGLAVMLASELWDPHAHAAIADWLVKVGRESGAPLVLRLGLAQTASAAVLAGDLGRAMAFIAEEEAIADASGGPPVRYHRIQLAAWQGRKREAAELFAASTVDAPGQLAANIHWPAAVLHNGSGEYKEALEAARRAVADGDLFLTGIALPELIEAALRCGEPDAAATALESLTERTRASATATGLGIAAYARGLVTGDEEHYREAVERLDDSPLLPYRARAHLLYGEWLRRRGRRRDCRRHLRTAHELLSSAGLEAFAARAADELRATGERARSRTGHTYDRLTMQEVSVARLVATGATSNEVAARLFLSPRTVDAHLRNIFRKLGITSRRQLRDLPELAQ